uniref:VWFA domain-containing protein n=1 Tax=Ananas comosus var. bracteatus TaxID=296719 RepID=A0A6V7PJE4_ANACO|nr:unnamed protein product [Ananas comosus var. bracteatus]
MGSRWRKAKLALGLNLCVYVPGPSTTTAAAATTTLPPLPPGAPRRSRRRRRKRRRLIRGCSYAHHAHPHLLRPQALQIGEQILQENMCHMPGLHETWTRAKWKEIPFRGPPSSDSAHGRARAAAAPSDALFRDASEPCCFDDDEPLDSPSEAAAKESLTSCMKTVEIKAFPEFSEISQSAFEENFTILIHLKAPLAHTSSRAPVDLVTVLDVSGSMAGTKLALLKRAMGFVIQNLGPSDRLSVIAFSSTARRLFPLRRMSESGRQHSLQAVNS